MIGKHRIDVGETHMTVLLDLDAIDSVRDAVFEARRHVENRIREDPFFGITHSPVEPKSKDPDVIKSMCEASVSANVGPMAAVAGAIAGKAVEAAVSKGCRFAVVENGGDIAYVSDREFTVGIYAGDSEYPGIAVRMPPSKGMKSVCSSSGVVGHAFSYGRSGISTVFSSNPSLADACATLLGNVSSGKDEEELTGSVESVLQIGGVDGCFTIVGELFVSAGEIPELVPAEKGEVFSKITL